MCILLLNLAQTLNKHETPGTISSAPLTLVLTVRQSGMMSLKAKWMDILVCLHAHARPLCARRSAPERAPYRPSKLLAPEDNQSNASALETTYPPQQVGAAAGSKKRRPTPRSPPKLYQYTGYGRGSSALALDWLSSRANNATLGGKCFARSRATCTPAGGYKQDTCNTILYSENTPWNETK
jgi:hypothetical protein